MLFIHIKYRNQYSKQATYSSIKRHSRWCCWWCWCWWWWYWWYWWWCWWYWWWYWWWCWWCVYPVLFAAVVVKSLQALSEAADTPSACLTLSEGKC